MKKRTQDWILKQFSKAKKDDKIDILFAALEIMQGCNSKSVDDCICMAMGYTGYENGWILIDEMED